MKPLSEEELTKCAEQDWQKTSYMEGGHRAFIDAYKQGYAKCIEQMQDEFNELLNACEEALQKQMNIDINEIIEQLKQ